MKSLRSTKQIKRMTAAALAVSLGVTTFLSVGIPTVSASGLQTAAYADTQNHWAQNAIQKWSDYGVIQGMENGNFLPDNTLTRAQFFTMLERMVGGSQRADLNGFRDLDKNAWYTDSLSHAVALGIAYGDDEGMMRPDIPITRQEMGVCIARVFGMESSNSTALNQFPDGKQVSPWAADAMSAVVSAGLMQGRDTGLLDPLGNATRAEAVTVLDNAVERLISTTASGNTDGSALLRGDSVRYTDAVVAQNLYVLQGVEKKAEFNNITVKGDVIVRGAGFAATQSHFDTINIFADNAIVELSANCSAQRIIIRGKNVAVKGTCKADEIMIEASGAVIDTKPESISIAKGITTTIAGKKYPVQSGGSSSGSGSASESTNESPDAAAIRMSMTNIDTQKGFKLVNVPYECTENHKNGETVGSHPYSSMYCSVGEVDQLVERMGYAESEYFMSGTANVYGLAEEGTNVPVILSNGSDYTTRILIHYPKNAEDFSGNIYVDILNASTGCDLEDIYRRSYEHFMENGDIYMGITSKSNTAAALKNFDAERYAPIDWLTDNKNPDSAENGLFWDMLSQLGTVLKERPEDLLGAELGAKAKEIGHTYLVGQSQSGFYIQTYLSVFYPYINNVLDGKDIFDGYFNAVGATPTVLSTGVSITNVGWPKTEEPYIVMMGEGEALMRLSMGYYSAQEDKNEADWKFRLYEVAGAPHCDPTAAILPNNFEIAKANAAGTSFDMKTYTGNHVEGDVHLDEFVTGALVNLDEWSRNAKPAPDGVLLKADDTGKAIARDEWGNALGGLRSPRIDAPLATYYGFINDQPNYSTEGSMIYFTQEMLNERYAGDTLKEKYNSYLAEFKESADRALLGRYITQSDYHKFIDWSKNTSAFGHHDQLIIDTQAQMPSVELQNVEPEKIFNSTAISVGEKDPDWNSKARLWTPALQLNTDGTIQYVNKSGDGDKLSVKYTEKEYFVSGEANLYNMASDNTLLVRESGLPYTNRILVRTPEDPKDFNGKVYVDILNASDKYDNECLWRMAYGMIMEEGAAYVGVTSKPLCVYALQQFDDHYDALSWNSPNTWLYTSYKIDKANGETAEEAYKKFLMSAGERPYTDIGLLWDILSQTGNAVKSNAEGMFGTGNLVEGVYLFGVSQSGFVMNTYFRFMEFLHQNNQKLPYDGFMNTVGTYAANKVNQSDATAKPINTPDGFYIGRNLGVPVMYVTSQNDYKAAFRPGESNVDEDAMMALYEIAGAPHSDPDSPTFPYNEILTGMGYSARDLFPQFKDGQVLTDYNSNMFVQALLLQLDAWAQEQKPPTKLDDPFIKEHENGSSTGGLRSPQLDVPVAYYYARPIGTVFSAVGTMVPYTDEELSQKYQNVEAYTEQFDNALAELYQLGLIRDTDKAYMEKYRDMVAEHLNKVLQS